MADTAARLLAERGYQATSFSDVIAASGAPRGSIYHHFPGGKDELVELAVRRQADRVIALVGEFTGDTPVEVVASFIAVWRHTLVATDFAVGCSLLAVTASTDGPLRDTAGTLFGGWIDALAARLVATGVDAAAAASFATTLLAAIEGAVAIARAQRSLAPFDAVATRLTADAATLVRD